MAHAPGSAALMARIFAGVPSWPDGVPSKPVAEMSAMSLVLASFGENVFHTANRPK